MMTIEMKVVVILSGVAAELSTSILSQLRLGSSGMLQKL